MRDTFEAFEKEQIYAASQVARATGQEAKIGREAPILEVIRRVMEAADATHAAANHLCCHTDRLRGEVPENAPTGQDVRAAHYEGGALGELLDALTHLESRLDYLNSQVARATTLA